MYKIGIKLLSSLSLIMLLSSCNWFGGSEEIPELPAGSAFKSLTFAANDSFPGLAKASFEVLPDTLYVNGELLSDSTIVNLDSLPYNTNITRVISTFSWQSISKAYIVSIDSTGALSDTTYLTGKDTIDFSRAVKIVNFAKDGNEEHRSQYLIKVNVHKVNPYLFVWQKIADEIYSHPVAQQKAVYFGSQIMLYASSESENYLYTSQNGKDWTDNTAAISGLPSATTIDLSQIVEFNGKLFLLDSQHNIYSSSDGFQWTGHGFPSLKSLLGVYKNELWAILQSTDNTYCFAHSEDATTWNTGANLPATFPVSNFASLSFLSATNVPKMLISGGLSAAGDTLRNTFSSENASYWVNFGSEKTNKLGYFADASYIKYNDKYFLFGGTYQNNSAPNQPILESINDGLSWNIPDSTYNYIAQIDYKKITQAGKDTVITVITKYAYRSAPSVIYVQKPNDSGSTNHFIYLIGGKNSTGTLSDVWVGQLNKMAFKRQ